MPPLREQIQILENKVRTLENRLSKIDRTGKFTFEKPIQILDGRNFIFGSGTGTKIGNASTQKLSLWGVTPVDQPETVADPSGGVTVDSQSRTAIIALIDRLQESGVIK